MKSAWLSTGLTLAALVASGCGGGGSSGTPPGSIAPPVGVAGQWQLVAQSSASPTRFLLVEANLTQTGTDLFAGKQAVVLIQGVQDASNPAEIDPMGLGGQCDSGMLFNASIQATISNAIQLAFTFMDAGSMGTAVISGAATFKSDGSGIMAGTYTAPGACGFMADSGTLTGVAIRPFAGMYSGMLNGGAGLGSMRSRSSATTSLSRIRPTLPRVIPH